MSARNLIERWNAVVDADPQKDAIVHWIAGSEPVRWTYGDLFAAAAAVSARLEAAGIHKGDVCGLILRHHPDFYPIYLGVAVLGAIPAVLAYPNTRLHPEKFRDGIRGMAQHSGLDWILTERELEPTLRPFLDSDQATVRGVLFPLDWKTVAGPNSEDAHEAWRPREPPAPGAPLLLQHSSGTTGLQKPVLLSHQAVLTHLDNYSQAIHLQPCDAVVSWLPLYHDMGLIAAFHLPLAFGIPSIQIDPFEWVKAPILLFQAAAEEKGSVAWLPNFAFNLMADRIDDEEMEGMSLDSIRMLINCSEPIREESHEKFLRRFSRYGLRREAVSTCYAMAETTFAVTQTPPGQEPVKAFMDRNELSRGRARVSEPTPGAKVCVSSGTPIEGCEVRIVSETGERVPEGQAGEVEIHSVSLFDGYRNYPDKTAEVLINGWYRSGDIGFCYQGQYFIVGRKKDIIIAGGQNIYPEDVEDAVNGVPGVIPGRVVAFGNVDPDLGTEQVSVIAETQLTDPGEQEQLRVRIRRTVAGIDVTLQKVHLVPPRWLIKSSAGKPSRKANKERVLAAGSPS